MHRDSGEHSPYFFLSYAHTPRFDVSKASDPDMWVVRLYQDLCEHVMSLTDHPAGSPVGFMDRDMLRTGENWSQRLSEALATCRVFVPLFSPRYFQSEVCGREWYAFSRRALESRYAQSNSQAIVPALWIPVLPESLPDPARHLPAVPDEFGTEYAANGLYGLMKLSIFRREYEIAVYQLARAIVRTATSGPTAEGRPLKYSEVPNAFGPRSGSRRLRIVVVAPTRDELPEGHSGRCYGESSLDWNPYRPASEPPLAEVTANHMRGLDYLTSTVSFEEAADELIAGDPPDAPTLMLLDRWALNDPRRRELLAQVDVAARPWVSVIVPWKSDDPDNLSLEAPAPSDVEKTLPRVVQRGRSVSRAATGGVPTLEAFVDVLPAVIQRATAQFTRNAVAHPPRGPAMERPRLTGPVASLPGEEATDDQRP
ncbi:TIR-like protein FxsC [Streptomyces sp. NPDC059373]